jgi:hypothetical protein
MSHISLNHLPASLAHDLEAGTLAPYLGPGLLQLCAGPTPPADPLTLATALTTRVAVPGKIKNRLTAAAQFIENFKHRKTLVKAMNEIFALQAEPSPSAPLAGHPARTRDRGLLVRRHAARSPQHPQQ